MIRTRNYIPDLDRVAVGLPCGGDGRVSSLRLHLSSTLRILVLQGQVETPGKKGASLPSEAEAPAIRAPFPWPPPASVVVVWIPGKMTYVYVFASDYAIAQRGYELHPVGLATVI